jgi:hypothetical protein
MRRSGAVASFTFDPRTHIAFGIGRMAIETLDDNIRCLFLSKRRLDISRGIGAVAKGQSRAVTHGIPGNPVLEILAIERPNWRDPANSCPEGPF